MLVHVIAPRALRAFWEKHPPAEGPWRAWQKAMQKSDFGNLNEVRETWLHADLVKTKSGVPVVVLNVGGNKYRLVVSINWTYKAVCTKIEGE